MLHYNSSLRPILTYASVVWSASAKTNLLLLFKSQNSVIRQIYNIPFYITNKQLCRKIPYPCLGVYIKKLNFNFQLALQNNNNPVLNELENYDHTTFANRNRPKAGLYQSPSLIFLCVFLHILFPKAHFSSHLFISTALHYF